MYIIMLSYYWFQGDGQTCEKAPNSSLVFAQREIIRQLSLDTSYLVDIVLPVPGLQHVVALDVDSLSGMYPF